MKLIRYLGSRRAKAHNKRYNIVDIGLYHCPACHVMVELPISVGRNKGSCGCQEKSVRRETIYRPKPAERMCLMCGKNFMSRGPHNRRCVLCEHKMEMGGQAYYMPPVHKQREHSVVAKCEEL